MAWLSRNNISFCFSNRKIELPYIPEYKSKIFGGFYKDKVRGSTYIRVYAPQKKITSEITYTRIFFQIEISHVM